MGIPVGTEQFQRDFLQEAGNGESAELVRALVPMPKRAFRFCVYLPLSPLTSTSNSLALHNMPSCSKLRRLVEWALTLIIAGDGAAAAGLPTPEEEAHDPSMWQIRPTRGTRPYGKPTYQSEKVTLGLPAAAPSKARHISSAMP